MLHWYVTYPCRAMLHVGVEPCSTDMSSCTYPCRAMLHVGVEPCSTVMSSFACRAMLHVGGVELCSTFNLHEQLVQAPPTSTRPRTTYFNELAGKHPDVPVSGVCSLAGANRVVPSAEPLSVSSHAPHWCRAMLHYIRVEPCSTLVSSLAPRWVSSYAPLSSLRTVSSPAPRHCRALLQHCASYLSSSAPDPLRLSSPAPPCTMDSSTQARHFDVIYFLYRGFVDTSSTL